MKLAEHTNLLRTLIAAQVALLEYVDEDLSCHVAKNVLINHLNSALRQAKKLEE